MDKGTISDLVSLILWSFGIFTLIIGGLISVLWLLGKTYLNSLIEVINTKVDNTNQYMHISQGEIEKNQEALNKLAASTHESIALQKQSHEQIDKRITLIEKKVFKI